MAVFACLPGSALSGPVAAVFLYIMPTEHLYYELGVVASGCMWEAVDDTEYLLAKLHWDKGKGAASPYVAEQSMFVVTKRDVYPISSDGNGIGGRLRILLLAGG